MNKKLYPCPAALHLNHELHTLYLSNVIPNALQAPLNAFELGTPDGTQQDLALNASINAIKVNA